MSVVEKHLSWRGGEVFVRQSAGTGLPLLLLHGSAASSAVFEKQFGSHLADRFRLIAMDFPGHGSSSDAAEPRPDYGIEGFAAAVLAILDGLGIARTAIYGWSLGGHVGIELLAAAPARVAGLMISGAPPVSRGPLGMLRGFHAGWDMLLASKKTFSDRDVDRFERLCFGDAGTPALREMIARADGNARVEFVRSMMRGEGADQRQTVEASTVPIAVVNGAEDSIVRLGYAAGLDIPHLWQGHAQVLQGAGHSPFLQTPEAFNRLLTGFMLDVTEVERVGTHQAKAPRVRSA